jgi:trans-aconitate 2-methyltransferase
VSQYTFGDDRSAVERLGLVAAAYEPVSRAFLTANAPHTTEVALDLGCGPAFSTQLLMEVCRPNTLVGIDSSAEFVQEAQGRLPGVRFVTHDVTTVPIPGAPAGLIYARLLLAHVPDPFGVVQGWLSQLLPAGILLIEDLEEVINPPGPLQEYEEVSTQIVRAGGGLMYAGAALAYLGGSCQPVTVPGALAARIYLFNIRRWRHAPTLAVGEEQLKELEKGLAGLVQDDQGTAVSWVVRQLSVHP